MQVTDTKYMLLAQEMERAVGFWRDTIGFEVSVASEQWSELRGPGAVSARQHGLYNPGDRRTVSQQVHQTPERCGGSLCPRAHQFTGFRARSNIRAPQARGATLCWDPSHEPGSSVD